MATTSSLKQLLCHRASTDEEEQVIHHPAYSVDSVARGALINCSSKKVES
ncbi:hypothetical protein VCHA50O407_230066 [Vibrio chagasii]|nr:hypothetical protein VCHA37O173_60060 [Vibrio chagasii]CAH7015051.1 hypothetical protein VCHA50P424_140067 [Vibrio chagasii]CAH7018421.1 hypothetical protein VCHA29O39_60060 [Vibrio chagasii]CAH7151126.1 hypothetical protein VCHA50O407_230066 [Vibrio chagasii]